TGVTSRHTPCWARSGVVRLLPIVIVFAGACSSRSHDRIVRVAAASDLSRAFNEIGREFEAKTGASAQFDFGSRGLLAKQIGQGAPYSLFAAANREYVDKVVRVGRCEASTVAIYSRGRLVVWTPTGISPPDTLAALADRRFRRIAIANPEHAPYGKA